MSLSLGCCLVIAPINTPLKSGSSRSILGTLPDSEITSGWISIESNTQYCSIKLNRANALLFKIRKYVSPKILRSIYFAIFDSRLSYCCLVWAQNFSSIKRILILQKKAVKIINFQPRNSHTSLLFKQKFILKFQDKICLENILFVSKSLNNSSPSIFNTWFSFFSNQHNYETSSSIQGNLMKLFL